MPVACFPPTPCPVCISRRLSHSSDLPPSVMCRLQYHNIPGERTLKRTLPHGRGNDTDADVTTDRIQRSLSAQNRRYKTGHADRHWKNRRNTSNKYKLIKNDILRRGLTEGLYSTTRRRRPLATRSLRISSMTFCPSTNVLSSKSRNASSSPSMSSAASRRG